RTPEKFDIAFIDPPFASDLAVRAMAQLRDRLQPGARVYVESGAALAPPEWVRLVREDRAGAVRYALYEIIS
ncbi:MAG TPA: RsmD family RNA methyltransferase, partial [Usitatibacter sp.]